VIDPVAVRRYAHGLAQERLRRERSLLAAVTPAERQAIEETASVIALRVADCLLGEAARCPPVAAALAEELARSYCANGSSKKKVEPSRSLDATQIRPPILRTSSREI
jgi:adenine/guanine phosphoribosyltransferase-like PRPP-binding protein